MTQSSMPVRLCVSFLFVVVMLPLLVGCEQPKKAPLRLGFNLWPGYAPLHMAAELGHLDHHPIAVVDVANTNELIRGMTLGTLDGGGFTLPELLNARDLGLDLVVILVTDVSIGADAVIARPAFSSMRDLKGQRIGVSSNALGTLMLERAAESVDLNASDFERVDVELDRHESVYEQGIVSAVITFEPMRSRLLEAGAVELFSSAQIPGEIVDVIAVTRDTWEQREPEIRAVLNGWFKTIALFENDRDRALAVMNKRLKLDTEAAHHAMDGLFVPKRDKVVDMLTNHGESLRPTMKRLESAMLESGEIASQAPLIDFFPAELATVQQQP